MQILQISKREFLFWIEDNPITHPLECGIFVFPLGSNYLVNKQWNERIKLELCAVSLPSLFLCRFSHNARLADFSEKIYQRTVEWMLTTKKLFIFLHYRKNSTKNFAAWKICDLQAIHIVTMPLSWCKDGFGFGIISQRISLWELLQ